MTKSGRIDKILLKAHQDLPQKSRDEIVILQLMNLISQPINDAGVRL
jgi:hypothetical protein